MTVLGRLRHPGPDAAAEWDRGPRVGSTVGRARVHNRRTGSRVPDFLGIGLTAGRPSGPTLHACIRHSRQEAPARKPLIGTVACIRDAWLRSRPNSNHANRRQIDGCRKRPGGE
jgi:hypothetical protein